MGDNHSNSGGKVRVKVRLINGEIHLVCLEEHSTVLQMKMVISWRFNMAFDQQVLTYRGQVLDDNQKLQSYNFKAGDIITLSHRRPTSSLAGNPFVEGFENPNPNPDGDVQPKERDEEKDLVDAMKDERLHERIQTALLRCIRRPQ